MLTCKTCVHIPVTLYKHSTRLMALAVDSYQQQILFGLSMGVNSMHSKGVFISVWDTYHTTSKFHSLYRNCLTLITILDTMARRKGYFKRKEKSPMKQGKDNIYYKKLVDTNKQRRAENQQKGQQAKCAPAPKVKSELKTYKYNNCPTMNRPTKRYTKEGLRKLVKPKPWDPFSIPGADFTEGSARILRPIKEIPKAPEPRKPRNHTFNIDTGNLIVEKSRLVDLFNEINKLHREADNCDNMDVDLVDFKPWGAFVSAVVECRTCGFRSERTRLYEEVKKDEPGPGRKAAVGNMGLQFSLQDTPIHNTEAQVLLGGLGLRPGSLNGMQELGYKAADITTAVGKSDLVRKQEYIINLLKERGVATPPEGVTGLLASAFDAMYSGVFKASQVTTGTGAQQAVGWCIEQLTQQHLVLGVDYVNRVCLTGSRLAGKGMSVICGPDANHANCTATQDRDQAIQEKDMAQRVAKKMYETSGLVSTHVVTDSDGKAVDGFVEANDKIKRKIEKKNTGKGGSKFKNKSTKNAREKYDGEETGDVIPALRWHKDRPHLGWNTSRHIKSHKFSANAFGTRENNAPWNYNERAECVKWLSKDIPIRVSHTIDKLYIFCTGDVDKMKEKSSILAEYMYKCYNGDHTKCERSRLAQLTGCHGAAEDKCWIHKSANLRAQGITRLNFDHDKEDAAFVKKAIAEKLSPDNIEFVAARLTTTHCESQNRRTKKNFPDNRNYFRTGEARVQSAALRANNSYLDATKLKYKASGCPIREDGALEVFKNYDKRRENIQKAQSTSKAKARKAQLKVIRKLNHAKQRLKATNRTDYRKYQLDEANKAHIQAIQTDTAVAATKKNLDVAAKKVERHVKRKAKRKINTQKKRMKTIKANQKAKNQARKVHEKSAPQAIHEHSYARI